MDYPKRKIVSLALIGILTTTSFFVGNYLIQKITQYKLKASPSAVFEGYCFTSNWEDRTKTADLPFNLAKSFLSYDHVFLPDKRLKQTVLTGDGKRLFARYLSWNESQKKYTKISEWTDRTQDLPLNLANSFISYDQEFLPYGKLKQTVLLPDGRTLLVRYVDWDSQNNKWGATSNWENRGGSQDLPKDGSFRSYDHAMLSPTRLKQSAVRSDGRIIFARYIDWDQKTKKATKVGEWFTQNHFDFPKISIENLDTVLLPDNTLKHTVLTDNGKVIYAMKMKPPKSGECTSFPLTTDLSISTSETVKRISPFIWGVNSEALPDMTSAKFLKSYPNVSKLNAKMIRYPGGSYAESFNWKSGKSTFVRQEKKQERPIISIDNILELSKKLNAEILYVLNIQIKGRGFWPSQYGGSLEDAKDLLRKYKGRLKYFEIGNEEWADWSPQEYIQTALRYAQALKAIDPSITLGLIGYEGKQGWNAELANLLRTNPKCSGTPCFGFVTDHTYLRTGYEPMTQKTSNYEGKAAFYPLSDYQKYLDSVSNSVNNKVPVAVTEWNLICWEFDNRLLPALHTVEHGLYALENLFMMAEKNVIIANIHDLIHTHIPYRTGNCGLFEEDNKTLTTVGQVFRLSSVAAGGELLKTRTAGPMFYVPQDENIGYHGMKGDENVPYLSAYAVKFGANKMYVFLINKHPFRDIQVSIKLDKDFSGSLEKVTLSSSSYTDKKFTETSKKSKFSGKILLVTTPPHGVIRLKFEK